VDSLDLLTRIDRIAEEEGVFPELFIEVNISGEMSKSGITKDELTELMSVQLKNSKIVGLMTMAPLESTESEQLEIFTSLKNLAAKFDLPQLSMGMSNDYRTAAACGATIVRIGTALFV
jgi:pyridoxal phosphate enzyme (YggS family)